MNPELPQVHPRTETLPSSPDGAERSLEQRPQQETERALERSVPAEQAPVDLAVPATPPPTAVPLPPPPASSQPANPSVMQQAPLVAGDDDLIEKEWVEKLKKIIALTKDDPYERARVIAQFQADYLKKRYNRSLGQVEE